MNEDSASPACERRLEGIREIADGVFAREAHAALSPSLWKNREEPAYELKFQVNRGQAHDLARDRANIRISVGTLNWAPASRPQRSSPSAAAKSKSLWLAQR